LDTCTFLWIIDGSSELSEVARVEFSDPANEILMSSVSAWEIAVKHKLGRLELSLPPREYVPKQRAKHGIASLGLEEEAALQVDRLPSIHRDPFDRMLVAQAIYHGLILLTPDPEIEKYPVRVLW
jgi:PIN domain nuclease of toxin-antitoxin system